MILFLVFCLCFWIAGVLGCYFGCFVVFFAWCFDLILWVAFCFLGGLITCFVGLFIDVVY